MALGSRVATWLEYETEADTAVVWPFLTRVKVVAVSVAWSIASEKVALGETVTATPVAAAAGAVELTVGRVVSEPALDARLRPVAVVVAVVSAVREHQAQLAAAGDRDVDGLGGR